MKQQNTTNIIKVQFENSTAEIDKSELQKDIIDIIMSNGDMIQFTKIEDNHFIATNGMNGYGQNLQKEVNGKPLIIL